ncbi:C10 family peptidase [Lutibacter sp. A80]|uniref:C10 family peptidase n=1 Tax=Lutibacter sp. A80 TaxID=2918453 RepID=UPI001F06EC28|nr:C10 family peptidase [Lutibacter sp. A80]UMB60657.1 C10 family peptidase [Lutibacter sp. A80]
MKKIFLKTIFIYLFTLSNTIFSQGNKPDIQNTNSKTSNTVSPILTDVWGSVNCKDNEGNTIYPSNYYTPSHASPGCVAISMSQILYYYKWPIKGVGSNVYNDNYNGTLIRHQAFFDNVTYDWDNMLDEYMNKASTKTQQKAIGELMYHTGVALQMDYEPSGSTSNINKTPFVYQNHFRYTSNYQDITWEFFWQRLNENILAGIPVPIAVSASRTGDGHVFIADGYKEVDGVPYYHLNWGWHNDNNINGWYNIQGWTSTSPGYNTITGAAFDILPNPQITTIESTGTNNSFTINWEVSDKITCDEFTLEQKIDEGDWEEVSTGITSKNYTITNPTGQVYQFRVKAKINGSYYENSWSEVEVHAINTYNGYAYFGGEQYAYARQTPDNDLDFTEDYTFETWIRLKDSNTNGNIILDQQDVFSLEITNITASNYAIKFSSYTTNTSLISNEDLTINEWTHIAVTHAQNQTKLYVNGILQNEDTGTNFNLTSSNNALNIGEKYVVGYSNFIKADLDQLRISSSKRYATNFTPNRALIYEIDSNTIAYFPFQNVHNVRLKDEASNLSVIVKNDTNYVEWKFEATIDNQLDDDNDGINNDIDLCPNTPIDEEVDANGCSNSQLDDDNDGVFNDNDLCPNTTSGTNVNSNGCFTLPTNNFKIETVGETCPNKNNGQLIITAQETQNYSTTIKGSNYNFTTNKTIENLAPGTYDFCISIEAENYEQCFSININEGTTISAKTSLQSKKLFIDIAKGTAPYTISVNGQDTFKTSNPNFSLDIKNGDLVQVKTSIECESTFSKTINLPETITIYPNPVKNSIINTITVNSNQKGQIIIYNQIGQIASVKNVSLNNGINNLNIDVSNLKTGLYIFTFKTTENTYSTKFIKE